MQLNDAPLAVAKEFCAAMDEERWPRVVELSDPRALKDLREERLRYARDLMRPESAVYRSWLRMLEAVPATTRSEYEELTRPSLEREFAGISSFQEVERLDAAALAVAVLSSRMVRESRPRRKWLGVIHEGEALAHVLYRVTFASTEEHWSEVELLSLRKESNRWVVLWNGRAQFGIPGVGGFQGAGF